MFNVTKRQRKKTEFKQFTVTIDQGFYQKIKKTAEENDMSLHGFVVSLLYSYTEYCKDVERNN